ncbi:4'-phosphopantetheinyl transferase superfamily protein [Aeromicrobium sp.]|uniref:4'-phosphopantetheinyl transferase family protein n=1 Tax=Aeromicrobium sp. TaxID=1871063 RepID=UPI0019A68DC0|nr:4'-phosphopantetheinyl transferase superfamily protein [Aeromicrobium sp.]MBC7633192.1 4'-phosphopantetheinyl transferase superfamily protein [Aeromicrobium sp.]
MSQLIVAWMPEDPRRTGLEMMSGVIDKLTGGFSAGVGFRIARVCRRCGSDAHGKPQVMMGDGSTATTHVSLSRAGGLVLVAATNAGPVGVDIEAAGAADFHHHADVVLHDEERPCDDPTRMWVRKESVLKATGHGLTIDPRSIRVSAPDRRPELLIWPAGEEMTGPAQMFDLAMPEGYSAALTVLIGERPEIVVTGSATAAG